MHDPQVCTVWVRPSVSENAHESPFYSVPTGKIPNMSEFYLSYYQFWFELIIHLGNIAKSKHQNKGTCSYFYISDIRLLFQLQNLVGNRSHIF